MSWNPNQNQQPGWGQQQSQGRLPDDSGDDAVTNFYKRMGQGGGGQNQSQWQPPGGASGASGASQPPPGLPAGGWYGPPPGGGSGQGQPVYGQQGNPYSGNNNSGGGGGQNAGAAGGSMYGNNPYLKQMGDNLTAQMTQNFQRKVLPGIGSQAMLAGGFGGSRQGVLEANAMNDLNANISSGLTDLYSKGYSADQSYDLGRRNNDQGYDRLDLERWRAERDDGYKQMDYERSLQNAQLQQNELGRSTGAEIYDRPMDYYDRFHKYAGAYGGAGSTNFGATQRQDKFMQAAGLANAGASLWDKYKSSQQAQTPNP